MKHLWESAHPYYCTEGCYFSNDCHENFSSWAEFAAEHASMDEDLNLLYRWDWKDGQGEDENGIPIGESRLRLFFMQQRKARPQSFEITVTRSDEPAVRAYLVDKLRHLMRLWAPIAPDIEPGAPAEAVFERAMLHFAESVGSR